MGKTSRIAVAPVKNRLTFLYVEHCVISRHDSAVTITDTRGVAYIPAAILSTLMLGPGTRISHRAVELLSDSGVCIVWVGEFGVRYYAHGTSLARSSRYITQQSKLVSNQKLRLGVARKMYQMRFPDEDVSNLTMQQLRGREGARIRQVYRQCSKQYGVKWDRREYNPNDFSASDPINRALSIAHACLYGVVHSVVVSLGLSPALGFVHTGLELSFVYDIADLYKAELTIPIAFQVTAKKNLEDLDGAVRKATRDVFVRKHLLKAIVDDIAFLLYDEKNEDEISEVSELRLWDDREGTTAAGISYTDNTE